MKTLLRGLQGILVATFFTAGNVPVAADELLVEPSFVVVNASDRSATFDIKNGDTSLMSLQLRLFRWDPVSGAREPASDVSVFPASFQLPGFGEQRARITPTAHGTAEGTYRLVVSELPKPGIQTSSTGVITLLRIDQAVFVAPISPRPQVKIDAEAGTDRVTVRLSNTGNAHLFASFVSGQLRDASGAPVGKAFAWSSILIPASVSKDISGEIASRDCSRVAKLQVIVLSGDLSGPADAAISISPHCR